MLRCPSFRVLAVLLTIGAEDSAIPNVPGQHGCAPTLRHVDLDVDSLLDESSVPAGDATRVGRRLTDPSGENLLNDSPSPTVVPSESPTAVPSEAPSGAPSTPSPTRTPTISPTTSPTHSPTASPTNSPTTTSPTDSTTAPTTHSPTIAAGPTMAPTGNIVPTATAPSPSSTAPTTSGLIVPTATAPSPSSAAPTTSGLVPTATAPSPSSVAPTTGRPTVASTSMPGDGTTQSPTMAPTQLALVVRTCVLNLNFESLAHNPAVVDEMEQAAATTIGTFLGVDPFTIQTQFERGSVIFVSSIAMLRSEIDMLSAKAQTMTGGNDTDNGINNDFTKDFLARLKAVSLIDRCMDDGVPIDAMKVTKIGLNATGFDIGTGSTPIAAPEVLHGDGALPGGIIAIVVVGSFGFVGILVAIQAYIIVRRRRRKRREANRERSDLEDLIKEAVQEESSAKPSSITGRKEGSSAKPSSTTGRKVEDAGAREGAVSFDGGIVSINLDDMVDVFSESSRVQSSEAEPEPAPGVESTDGELVLYVM